MIFHYYFNKNIDYESITICLNHLIYTIQKIKRK